MTVDGAARPWASITSGAFDESDRARRIAYEFVIAQAADELKPTHDSADTEQRL